MVSNPFKIYAMSGKGNDFSLHLIMAFMTFDTRNAFRSQRNHSTYMHMHTSMCMTKHVREINFHVGSHACIAQRIAHRIAKLNFAKLLASRRFCAMQQASGKINRSETLDRSLRRRNDTTREHQHAAYRPNDTIAIA